jgi:hypothetical protein
VTEYIDESQPRFAPVPSTPFVLSRRWDRFGGRLLDITNGLFVARALDVPFRFDWMHDDRNPETDAQLRFFDPEFVARYALPGGAFAGLTGFAAPDYERLSAEVVRAEINGQPAGSYFCARGLFEPPVIYGQSDRERRRQFRSLLLEMMAPEFRNRLTEVGNAVPVGRAVTVVHARFGDLVDGGFRQYPEPTKYVPYFHIDLALESLSGGDALVLLATDSPEAARALRLRHPHVETAIDLGFRDGESDELDTMFTDIALFAAADRVIGPALSAFSTLGAALGERRVESVRNVLVPAIARDIAAPHPHVYAELGGSLRGAFESRDLCAFLDRNALALEPQQYLEVAVRATTSDPRFVLAWCHAAAATVLAGGNRSDALELLARARPHAEEARVVHSDPFYFVAAAEFFVRLYAPLAAGETRVRFARLGRLVGLARILGSLGTQQADVDDIRVATRKLVGHAEPRFAARLPSALGRVIRQTWMAFVPARFPAIAGRPFATRFREHAIPLDYPNLVSALIVALGETCEDH